MYYLDVSIENQEFDLLLSAREPHLALISTECARAQCRVPSPYDITKSGERATLFNIAQEENIDFYDLSSNLFETKLSGTLVTDTLVFESDSE